MKTYRIVEDVSELQKGQDVSFFNLTKQEWTSLEKLVVPPKLLTDAVAEGRVRVAVEEPTPHVWAVGDEVEGYGLNTGAFYAQTVINQVDTDAVRVDLLEGGFAWLSKAGLRLINKKEKSDADVRPQLGQPGVLAPAGGVGAGQGVQKQVKSEPCHCGTLNTRDANLHYSNCKHYKPFKDAPRAKRGDVVKHVDHPERYVVEEVDNFWVRVHNDCGAMKLRFEHGYYEILTQPAYRKRR